MKRAPVSLSVRYSLVPLALLCLFSTACSDPPDGANDGPCLHSLVYTAKVSDAGKPITGAAKLHLVLAVTYRWEGSQGYLGYTPNVPIDQDFSVNLDDSGTATVALDLVTVVKDRISSPGACALLNTAKLQALTATSDGRTADGTITEHALNGDAASATASFDLGNPNPLDPGMLSLRLLQHFNRTSGRAATAIRGFDVTGPKPVQDSPVDGAESASPGAANAAI